MKHINDTHGHAAGDEVPRAVARSLSDAGNHGDLHGRLGGDEFVVAALLPPTAGVYARHHRVQAATCVDVAGDHASDSVGIAPLTADAAELAVRAVRRRLMVILAIYLRQCGSSRSKPVDSPLPASKAEPPPADRSAHHSAVRATTSV